MRLVDLEETDFIKKPRLITALITNRFLFDRSSEAELYLIFIKTNSINPYYIGMYFEKKSLSKSSVLNLLAALWRTS